jgi:DNA polymerase-3 subunit delta'
MGYDNYPGNEELKKLFKKLISSGVLPQSLILQGGKFSFKEKTGFEIAKALHCEKGEGESCGECKHCRLMSGLKSEEEGEIKPSHPDFLFIEPEKDIIKIDTIRGIMEFIISRPMISKRKVVLIKDIDRMNIQAFNAFLKILEEPYPYVYYILTTERLNFLADTIRSRCQVFHLKNVNKEKIYEFYKDIPTKTIDYALEIGVSPEEAEENEVMVFENLKSVLSKLSDNGSTKSLIELKDIYDKIERNHKKEFLRILIGILKNRLMDKIYNLDKIKEDTNKIKDSIFKIEEMEQDIFKNMNSDIIFAVLISDIIL